MAGRVYYKTDDGSMYSVSRRVHALGPEPETAIPATVEDKKVQEEEQKTFLTKAERVNRAQLLLNLGYISKQAFTRLVARIPEDPIIKVEVIPEPKVEAQIEQEPEPEAIKLPPSSPRKKRNYDEGNVSDF
jgi:hypothetical protein